MNITRLFAIGLEQARITETYTIIWPVLIYATGVATPILLRYLIRYVRAYRKEAKRKKGEEGLEEMKK
ncbi:unnamed protein product [marine sediment metagenome]|uniref:DUF2062 domain-containing protein n=1 Tax=marine sediment metagenome TaxID=412755 RepID=X0SLC2_9ZZZZ